MAAKVDVLVLCDTNGGSLPWEVICLTRGVPGLCFFSISCCAAAVRFVSFLVLSWTYTIPA